MITPALDKIPKELNDDRVKIDPEPARRFLKAIFDQYLKEAYRPTYIEVRSKREADSEMTFRRFYIGIDPLINDMKNWPTDQHYWFGVALRWSNKYGKKEHCIILTVIFTDVDYGIIGHKKKNRWQTREEAQEAVEAFPIKPSIIVHTGGGFQVFWILSEPFNLGDGNCGQIEAIMKGIGVAIGGDSGTQDVSRIFRIPGTFNVKTGEPRPVEIIRCNPKLVYDLADFVHYADLTCKQRQNNQEGPTHRPQTTKIDELNVPAWVRGLIRSGDTSRYDNDRSKRDHAVIGALKRAGCDLDTIEEIFRHHPVGDRYREEEARGKGLKYLRYSFDKDSTTSHGSHQRAQPEDGLKTQTSKQQSPEIQFVTGRELQSIEFKEPEWIVKGILPEGLCLLSARPKKGKTWFALNCSVAKSTGGCALSKADLRLPQGKVLYLCLEDKLRRAKKRLRTILGDTPFPEGLILAENWPLLDKGGLEALQDFLKEHSDCKLVVIDSFAKIKPARPKNADPYDYDMRVGGVLQNLAHQYQICLLIIYHNRKAESEDPLDDVIGSTGLTGAVDAVLILRRGRGQADGTLFITGRDVEEQELALRFHPQEGLWKLLGDAAEYAKSQERQEVLKVLRGHGPKTPTELSNILNKKANNIKALLWKMAGDGEVRSVGGKYEIIKK